MVMPTPQPEFPFSAIVGQQSLKTALLLNAINPRIGGVLISGPRGIAKSTMARGLADVLPLDADGQHPPFINLPLGTSEDRLTGALNLQQVLSEQKVVFEPGLLARAHQGVLYVDEVNLLPDALVDLLLDTAARGINVVEREGISHTHDARFMLIGTMNPDEGELRPQLLDRFGLCVELGDAIPVSERVAIVRQREAFEHDPHGYCHDWQPEQANLTERLRLAREALPSVTAEDWVYEHIAMRCQSAAVEGLRADVTWHRAAQAHAAWRNADSITAEDLDAVEGWVLAHRRKAAGEPPAGGSTPPGGDRSNQGSSRQQNAPQLPKSGADAKTRNQGGQWGAMPPQQQSMVAVPPVDLPDNSAQVTQGTRDLLATRSKKKGKQSLGRYATGELSRKPDWFATFAASRGQWPLKEWRFKRQRAGQPVLHFILLDTSGSTLDSQLFARAKGLVQQLAAKAYSAREQLAILGFGNDRVDSILPKRRAPSDMLDQLEKLGGGGGTPIRDAMQAAVRAIVQWQRREPGLQVRTYLITDGRTRQSLDDIGPVKDCVVIDIEQSPVRRGRARSLAEQLGATYQIFPPMEAL